MKRLRHGRKYPARTESAREPAFTLVELMIVLAVIALLAGMIFPAFLKHREKAMSTLCKSNLRQFVAAFNSVPPGDNVGSGTPSGVPDVAQNMVVGGQAGNQDWGAAGLYHAVDPTAGNSPAEGYIFDFVFTYIKNIKVDDQFYWKRKVAYDPPFVQATDPGGYTEDPHASVCYCPAAVPLLSVFNTTNRPNRRADQYPPPFKGTHFEPATGPMPDPGRYCVYARNSYALGGPLSQIPGRLVLFCDWNLKDGWQAELTTSNNARGTANTYQFTSPAGANPYHRQNDRKNDLYCRTDVGFHHASGKDFAANVAMFDGRVESVVSNQITNAAYWQP